MMKLFMKNYTSRRRFYTNLPFVHHASPIVVLDVCRKGYHLWSCFEQLKLTTNVWINQQEKAFSQWLLKFRRGLLNSQLDNVPYDTIGILNESVCNKSFIADNFSCTPKWSNELLFCPRIFILSL